MSKIEASPSAEQSAGRRSRWVKRGALCVCVGVLGFASYYWGIRWYIKSSLPATLREAEKQLTERRTEDVRRTLKWTLRYQPDHDLVLLLWGTSLYADRKFYESIEFLERVSPKSKRGSEAELFLASALMHDLQVERAEQVFLRHLDREPQSIQASHELRLLYLRELRLRDATIF